MIIYRYNATKHLNICKFDERMNTWMVPVEVGHVGVTSDIHVIEISIPIAKKYFESFVFHHVPVTIEYVVRHFFTRMSLGRTTLEVWSKNWNLLFLGGGNSNILYFQPDSWGNDPIWRAYFSDGLKPPTSILIAPVDSLGPIPSCPFKLEFWPWRFRQQVLIATKSRRWGTFVYTKKDNEYRGKQKKWKQHIMPYIFVVLMQDCACFPVFSIWVLEYW